MANLLLLKRRIKAAGNVSKTTKAMQMIAVSKLKKAQDATLAGRPYVEKLSAITQNLSSKVSEKFTHEYIRKLKTKDGKEKSLVLVISPDKGLCGGLITNLIKEVIAFDSASDNIYLTIGKKVENSVNNLGKEIVASFKFDTILPSFEMVLPIVKIIDECFLGKKVANVQIISTNFTSVFSQKPKITKILPIEFQEEQADSSKLTLIEPNAQELLPILLKHYLEMIIYQQLLEAYASEQGARMFAMQNATDNALDVVHDLQLEYNKQRQEKITNEILDIGGAAFSLAYEE